jgi:hypothetical protein
MGRLTRQVVPALQAFGEEKTPLIRSELTYCLKSTKAVHTVIYHNVDSAIYAFRVFGPR